MPFEAKQANIERAREAVMIAFEFAKANTT